MTTTIHDLRAWKTEGKRWVMLTAYDFPTAQILDDAGVPVLLVGDSRRPQRPRATRTAAGHDGARCSTTRARSPAASATRWSSATCRSCRTRPPSEEGIRNAGRFMKEAARTP